MDILKVTTLVLFIPIGVLLSDAAVADSPSVEACPENTIPGDTPGSAEACGFDPN